MSSGPEAFDGVLVVGAGPSGMSAAVVLARLGVPVLVLEAGPALSTMSRASTFHPPTIELMEVLGVRDGLEARGLRVSRYQYRSRSQGLLAEFDLSRIADLTPYPYRLQCEQSKLTPLLLERLRGTGRGDIVFDAAVSEVRDRGDRVEVTTVDPGGRSRVMSAQALVGADGASSRVRQSLGIEFSGMTYEEEFVVVTTDFDFQGLIDGLAPVSYIADGEEWLVLLRIPDAWRVLFPRPAGERLDDAATLAVIHERLGVLCGPTASDARIIQWSRYHVHQRVADRLRQGRVLLVGDAAHVNSPIGGLGMNSGIHDAFLAAQALSRFLAGEGEEVLDGYSSARTAFAKDTVQRMSDRNTRALQRGHRAENSAWMSEIVEAGQDAEKGRAYMAESAMLPSSRELVRAATEHLAQAGV